MDKITKEKVGAQSMSIEDLQFFTELTPEEAMALNGGFLKKTWRQIKRAVSTAAVDAVTSIATSGIKKGGSWLSRKFLF